VTHIDTAIVPVAGLGTRMLPATKEQPKEMLPVPVRDPRHGLVFKPFLQLVYEQLHQAGVRRFIFVVGRGKRIIEDYFTPDWGYTSYLRGRGKHREAEILEDFYQMLEDSTIVWVNQPEPRGFGDAVLRGVEAAPAQSFIVHAGDIAVLGEASPLRLLVEAHQRLQPQAAILVRQVPDPQHYGVAIVDKEVYKTPTMRVYTVRRVIEKPKNPPTNLAITAVYVFTRRIADALRRAKPGERGEIELTDAIQELIDNGETVIALNTTGTSFIDIGRPEAYIEAIKTLTNHRPPTGPQAHRP